MTPLRLRLLGSPELICGGQQAVFKTRKASALLAYLAVEQGSHAREEVADLLWPSGDAENARSSLRTTVRYLRSALGDAADAVLVATRDSIGLAPSAPLESDVELLSDVRRQIRAPGDPGLRDEVQQAISLYRGPFFGDLSVPDAPEFEAWLAGQRAHWLGVVSELLECLSTMQTEAGDVGAALLTLDRWAVLDPAEDVAWQRMIELHLAQGNRVAARQAWGAYRRALADLGIEASAQLEALRTQIEGRHQAGTTTGHHTGYPLGVVPDIVGAPSAPQTTDLMQMPFVGRARELMQLRRAFEQARAGEPQVVVLEGEAGIGKTRLGEEFLAWAAIQGADVLRSRGFETTVDLPFAALIEALRSRLERENAPDDLLDDPWLAEVSRLLPELRARYPDLSPATSDPVLQRNQLFEAVTRLGKGLAERHPLVVFRDDWHWADAGSRDLVRYAVRRWSDDHDRVMVILTVSVEQIRKDRALAQWMGSLERDAPTTRLGLERLTEPDIVLWMAALAGTEGEGSFTDAAASRLGDWLMERAVGNPSRIVSALRSLFDQQVLSFRKSEEGSWRLDLSGLSQLSAALPGYHTQRVPGVVPGVVVEGVAGAPTRQQDWGDAPDARLLYGRREELEQLERWVVTDRCREVAVVGIGGIGKTALAARLAHDVAPHFEFVYWRSLRNALPCDEWLSEAVRALSEQQQVTLPENQEARILLLLELLKAHRCLLVLDNLETVLQPGQRHTTYLEGYAPYGLLMRRLGEVEHQSCLVLTSREKPVDVGLLEGELSPVRTFHLTGLGAAAGRALLEHELLDGVDEDWEALVERYAGNPLALQVVAETIGDVFAGEIAAFLTEGEAVYGGIRRVLEAQFVRLSALEKTLLTWLAVEREPVGFVELVGDLEPPAPRGDVLEALESLRHRSLLERGRHGGGFTLQPVVLEYVTNRLVSAAVREIRGGDLELVRAHALRKAQSKSYVRQSQERLIVAPILDRLAAIYGSEEEVEGRLLELVDQVRSENRRDYAPGNVVNFLHQLRGNLRGLDLSHLFIRQVYLQEDDAQDANLTGSHLSECTLAEAFDCCISVAFSPDGRYLAAGTFNGEVCVWRLADRKRIVATRGHTGLVWGLDWASDGHLFATGGLEGTVKLWEADSGRLLATLEGHTGSVWRVCLSADGHLIASGSQDGTVKLWETRTGRLLHTLQGHEGAVWGVELNNNSQLVASASVDGTVKLWDASSGSLLTTLDGHSGAVYDVVLTADWQLAATGGQDGMIRLWELTSGHPVSTLQGHTQQIWRLALSNDGQLLVSGSQDGTVRLWEITRASGGVPGGACLAALEAHNDAVYDVAISPDARQFASVSQDGTARLWEVPSGKPVTTLEGYTRGAWGLAWDGAGRLLASGTQDSMTNLWDVTSGALHAALCGHTAMVFCTALSEDGQLLASGSQDCTIRLWQVADCICLRTLQAHAGGVYGLAFSPDARLLISGGQDGLIKLWDVSSGEPLTTLRAHTGLIWSIALSGDGHLLASASQDGTINLWDIPSGRLLTTMRDHDDLFWGVALSRDGKLVASGGQSGRVTLWEAPSGRFLATLGAHEGPAWGMSFSQDTRLVTSGGADGTVMLWDVATRHLIARCMGHDGPVNKVAVGPDGSLVASSGQDGAVMLWDSESGAWRGTLRPDRRYERMDITGVTGVSEVQKTVLTTLGAVERETALRPTSDPAQISFPHPPATPQVAASLPASELLPPAPEPPPTNVRAVPTTFIGRSADVAALIQVLDPAVRGPSLLTLTGVAGSGKTRLALAVAEAVRDAYRDGVWLVDLSLLSSGADLTMVVTAMLTALGLPEQAGQEVRETLIASLRPRRLLLLLDNCEHVAAATATLSAQLLATCPELSILATSQQALSLEGETVWPVAPLAVPPQPSAALSSEELSRLEQADAVRLFVARAQMVRPGFTLTASNAATVAAICRRLDGLPLALELAAARLNVLSAEDLLTRLDDRFRLLRHGHHAPNDRHEALQATMDWSFGLLDPAEQALLRRLAVFVGGWELVAAEAVCTDAREQPVRSQPVSAADQGDKVEAESVLELLDELQDRSLVYVDLAEETPRYGMLDTVRQYGLQQLDRAGEAAIIRHQHLDWCLALAEQAAPHLRGSDQEWWLARLEREHDNLRAALRWSLDSGAADSVGLRLAGALARFWLIHAHFSEGRQWLRAALATEGGTATERALALEGTGLLTEAQGAYDEATGLIEQSVELWRTVGDRAGVARALTNLGLVTERQSNYGPARTLLEDALDIFRDLDARGEIAATLTALGLVVEFQGDYPTAWTFLEQALRQFRSLGDEWGIANTLGNMAITARRHGEYERALTLYEEALATARAVGDRRGIARWLNGLALSLASRGEYDRAQALLQESLAISRAQGDLRSTAASLNDLGEIARKQGMYGRARSLFEDSLALQRQFGDGWGIANSYRNLADIAAQEGDTEQASRLVSQSLARFQEVGDRWGAAYCLELGGRLAAAHSRWAEAAWLLAGAVALREAIGTQLERDELEAHERLLRTVRMALGEDRFADEWVAGSSLALDELVAMLASESYSRGSGSTAAAIPASE